jgi:hypothetical protein
MVSLGISCGERIITYSPLSLKLLKARCGLRDPKSVVGVDAPPVPFEFIDKADGWRGMKLPAAVLCDMPGGSGTSFSAVKRWSEDDIVRMGLQD